VEYHLVVAIKEQATTAAVLKDGVVQLLITAVMDVKRAMDRVGFKCRSHRPHLNH